MTENVPVLERGETVGQISDDVSKQLFCQQLLIKKNFGINYKCANNTETLTIISL